MLKQPLWLFFAGVNMSLVGLASFVNHASNTRFGNLLDHAGIPPAMGFLSIYAIADLFLEELNRVPFYDNLGDKLSPYLATISFITLPILAFYNEYHDIISIEKTFGIVGVIAVLTILMKVNLDKRIWQMDIQANNEDLFLALVSLAIGGIFYEWTVPLPCWPHSLW